MNCPYCENKAELVSGIKVYPHRRDLYTKLFYVCDPCDARVGVHQETGEPLGTLAKKELRTMRVETHLMFDALWKDQKYSRTTAYEMMKEYFGEEVHIGSSDEDRCEEIKEFVKLVS